MVEKYVISPTSEIIFDSNSIKFFRESFRKCKIENKDEFYKSISNGLIIPGSEQFYPILYNDYDSLLNYLGEYYFFFWEELINNYQNNYHDLTQEIKQSNANILNESNFFQDEKKLNKLLQNSKIHYLTNSNYHSDTLVFF